MAERAGRELKRLTDLRPSDEVLDRARLGSVSSVSERRSAPRAVVIIVAFAVFASTGVLTWRAFAPASTVPSTVWAPGYPSPPASGYYILLPDEAAPLQGQEGQAFDVGVTALTNLPDGTVLAISTTDEGGCCPAVKDSKITFTEQDSACYGYVGHHPQGATFDVTITAKPSFEPWVVPGPMIPGGQPSKPPKQPDSVIQVLGQDFQNLSGDEIQVQKDGSKWLVAEGAVGWPEPRCGADPIPMFGGKNCDPTQLQQQLQGDNLAEAMPDVMGAIAQGRMCEFWSEMLPPDVEAQHPWPEFASEWRAWLLEQDFSDADPSGNWSETALRWVDERADGSASGARTVDIVHDGERIATLVLQPLPDYCPSCDPNVVPFWGVMSWRLHGSEAGSSAPPSPG